MPGKWLCTAIFNLLVSMQLGGCAIYSEARDKQGIELTDAWKKVALDKQISIPRENLKLLLGEQLTLEEKIWTTRRDGLASTIASGKIADLIKNISDALIRVRGSDDLRALDKTKRDATRMAESNLRVTARHLKILNKIDLPTCDFLLDDVKFDKFSSANKSGEVDLKQAKKDCKTISLSKVPVTYGGEIKKASNELSADVTLLEKDRAEFAAEEVAYQVVADYYEKQLSKSEAASNDLNEKVASAVRKLAKLPDLVEKSNNAFGIELLSQARINSINKFLSSYTTATDLSKTSDQKVDLNKTAIALAVFPDLIKKAEDSVKDLQKPNLVPLLQEKEFEQTRLAAAQREIEIRKQKIQLKQARLEVLMAQLVAYEDARAGLSKETIRDNAKMSMIDAVDPSKSTPSMLSGKASSDQGLDFRASIYRAAAQYLDAEGRLRAENGKLLYQITALEYEKSLSYAETSLNQWKVLIEPSIDLMAQYGASGLKSTDITNAINSAMLLLIAIGVN